MLLTQVHLNAQMLELLTNLRDVLNVNISLI
jgi:hypothetical protein